MAHIEKTVFISYRRKDISWALAVYQYLTAQKFDVFFDYTSLSSGDFEEVIVSNIRARAHFVLILTPTALNRCSEPGDWLRREIETAVDENRNIIPLFFDGFSFGTPGVAEKLTGKLAAVNRYNGLEVPPGYFLEAMDRLKNRYLNIPLNAVIRPVPTQVRKVVQETQEAANRAVEEQREDIEKLVKPAEEKDTAVRVDNSKGAGGSPPGNGQGRGWIKTHANPRFFGISAGVFLVLALLMMSISQGWRTTHQEPTALTEAPITVASATEVPETMPPVTETQIPASPTAVPTDTMAVSTTSVPPPSPGSTRVADEDSMVQVYVPGGDFEMGSDTGDADEKPVHTVYLDPFWIDQTEITNAMYNKCVDAEVCKAPALNKSNRQSQYYGVRKYDNYPVIYVSWNDANAYCTWVNKRLPTEAEWEKAASRWNEATQQNDLYPWGNKYSCSLANYQKSSKEACTNDTTDVSAYPSGMSSFGALNMAGNVWEWVNDYYDVNYYDQNISWQNPTGPSSGDSRVFRGGSFKSGASELRVSNRGFDKAASAVNNVGFRCVSSP